jgi:FKBP-type peptidyl-prolyl cis-trans isomerase
VPILPRRGDEIIVTFPIPARFSFLSQALPLRRACQGREIAMRSKKVVMAVAAVCIGTLTLAGCNQQQASNTGGTAQSVATQAASQSDMSPEGNQKFLADNAKKDGVKATASGLQYRVIKAGAGKSPTVNDQVTVTYKGWLIDGTVFDQTQPGQSATFPAGALIPGWVEALQLMKEGDEWEIVIPSKLGYGEAGAGGVIPPNQTLVFDMALLTVQK